MISVKVLRSLARSPPNELRDKRRTSNSRMKPYFFFAGWAKSTTLKPSNAASSSRHPQNTTNTRRRTWRKALLELLSLVCVVQREGVQISCTPNFKLGLRLAGGCFCSDLLYPGLCRCIVEGERCRMRKKCVVKIYKRHSNSGYTRDTYA